MRALVRVGRYHRVGAAHRDPRPARTAKNLDPGADREHGGVQQDGHVAVRAAHFTILLGVFERILYGVFARANRHRVRAR